MRRFLEVPLADTVIDVDKDSFMESLATILGGDANKLALSTTKAESDDQFFLEPAPGIEVELEWGQKLFGLQVSPATIVWPVVRGELANTSAGLHVSLYLTLEPTDRVFRLFLVPAGIGLVAILLLVLGPMANQEGSNSWFFLRLAGLFSLLGLTPLVQSYFELRRSQGARIVSRIANGYLARLSADLASR